MAKTALITGSAGLIGSEGVTFLDERGWRVHGIDNNMRRDFFGSDGDTTWNLERLRRETKRYTHHDLDIRDREAVFVLFAEAKPDLVFSSLLFADLPIFMRTAHGAGLMDGGTKFVFPAA